MPGYHGYDVSHNADGSLLFSCSPKVAGTYKITVERDGCPLDGLPIFCVVQAKDHNYTTAYLMGRDIISSVQDAFSNTPASSVTVITPTENGLDTAGGNLTAPKSEDTDAVNNDVDIHTIFGVSWVNDNDDTTIFADSGAENRNAENPMTSEVEEDDDLETVESKDPDPDYLSENEDSFMPDFNDDDSDGDQMCELPNLKEEAEDPESYVETDGTTTAAFSKVPSSEVCELPNAKDDVKVELQTGTESTEARESKSGQKTFSIETSFQKRDAIHACDFEGCDKKFKFTNNLKIHKDKAHGNQHQTGGYACNKCSKKFGTNLGLLRHLVVHDELPECDKKGCGKTYNSRKLLSVHMKTHKKDMMSCPICKGITCDFETHTRKHYPFVSRCLQCLELFMTTEAQKVHKCESESSTRNPKMSNASWKCPVCSKSYLRLEKLRYHAVNHTTDRPFICNVCDKSFKIQEALQDHKNIVHKPREHRCKVCENKAFHSKSKLVRHMKSHVTGNSLSYSCQVCRRSFKYKETRKYHRCSIGKSPKDNAQDEKSGDEFSQEEDVYINNKKYPYSCDVCHKNFKYKDSLQYHCCKERKKRSKDEDDEMDGGTGSNCNPSTGSNTEHLKCKICGKLNSNPFRMMRHMMTHSDERLFMCEICGKSLKTENTLKTHVMEMHSTMDENTAEAHICSYCGKKYRRISHLKIHIAAHESKELIPCEEEGCKKTFPTKFKLKVHRRAVHTIAKDGLVTCDQCHKSFKNSNCLKTHMLLHTNTFWQCTEPGCNSKFTVKNSMLRHIASKHGTPNYSHACTHEDCTKKFKTKGELTIHMGSHRDKREFSCSVCGKDFKTIGTLRLHEITHNPDRQHPCPHCGRTFTRKHRLKAHIQSQHYQ